MAEVALGSFISMNGIDLGCVLTSVKISGKADLKQSTALCATASHTWQKGLIDRDLSAAGFFKHSATTADDANGLFQTALVNTSSDYLILFGRDGSDNGDIAEMLNASEVSYDVETAVGELIAATMSAKVTATSTADDYVIGVFLMNQTVTGATNGTSYDSTSGGTGYLVQIHVLDGDGTAAVKIQHSSNNSTWADLFASANYTVNTATQLSSTVTAVNRYVRAVATPNGTTAEVAVSMKVGYTG